MIRVWNITMNGCREIHLPDQSSLDAVTRGLPDGYYTTFRTFGECTRALGLKAHLRRIYDPVPAPKADASSLRRQLLPLLEPFRPEEARVRLVMTGDGEVYAAIERLEPLPPEVYLNGVKAITTALERKDPRLKSTAFIGASVPERKHIAREGIFEALLVKNGRILEGMTSNFFHVKNNVLFTAGRDVLPGVTRRTVIRIARGRGVEVRYRPLKPDQLSAVNEAFLTSSSRGIVPVVQIDAVTVGDGRVGALTRMLISAYNEYVSRSAEKISPVE